MHPNRLFAWTDEAEMLDFLRQVSFCTIFFSRPDGLQVIHAPVTVHAGRRLRFHVSRSNRATAGLDGAEVLISCLGPDAYISPDWYGTQDQVPTWNYLALECEGRARLLPQEELAVQLDSLSAEHEARLAPKKPWTREKMTPGLFERMIQGIFCFEIEIRELRSTRKLGQNKKGAEREGALAGLAAAGREDMAALMASERDPS